LVIIKRLQYLSVDEKKIADDEIAMLKKVQSKHIIRFIESFIDGFDICIVMEYYSGGNLRTLINTMKSWTPKDRKNVFKLILFIILLL
jgi:serine/threonine protein kinase